jgi:hypothetical protein
MKQTEPHFPKWPINYEWINIMNGFFAKKGSKLYPHNEYVEEAVETGALELGLATIHHELGVESGKDDQTVAPARVAEHAAAQQHLLIVDRQSLSSHNHPPFETVQVIIWRLACHFS